MEYLFIGDGFIVEVVKYIASIGIENDENVVFQFFFFSSPAHESAAGRALLA